MFVSASFAMYVPECFFLMARCIICLINERQDIGERNVGNRSEIVNEMVTVVYFNNYKGYVHFKSNFGDNVIFHRMH